MRRLSVICPVGVAVAVLAASAAAGTGGVVPKGDILAVGYDRQAVVLAPGGHVVRRLAWHVPSGRGLAGIELAPDRKHAFVSLYNGNAQPAARLYEVDLTTGAATRLADAVSPALSPDGRRLLYLTERYVSPAGYTVLTGLAIRTLASGHTRTIPFDPQQPFRTPPDIVANWSPDGRHVALLGGPLRIVDTATAGTIESQPSPGGGTAPAFLDAQTLVVLSDCCMGRQHLVTVDVSGGKEAPFAEISSPVVSIRRFGAGRMLVVDQLGELLLVTRGKTTRIATRIAAATA